MGITGFLIALFVLVIIHELGHFLAAKLSGVKVEEFAIGFPPRLISFRKGETLYSINLLPLGGYVKVYGEEYDEKIRGDKSRAFVYKKPWQKLFILTAGVIGNFLLGWVLISYLFTQGVPVPTDTVRIQEVVKNSPAYQAGIRSGDIIKSLEAGGESVQVKTVEQVVEFINKYKGSPVLLTIIRDGKTLQIEAVPRKNPPPDQGALGIVLSNFQIKKYSLYQAPVQGLIEAGKTTLFLVQGILTWLWEALTKKPDTTQITGPIGIAKITANAFTAGKNMFLQVIALLSLNLAVVNLLPFPALDGGRVVMVVYEWISGRRINKSFERWANLIGFAILISLVIIISIYDIKRFFLN